MRLRSIKYRIVLSFLVASLIPFIASIFLVFKKGEEHLIDNIIDQQYSQITFLKKTILRDFHNLHTELSFWSENQILNDILVDDIDKRIQKFLFSIKENKDVKGVLFVSNIKGVIISSTEKSLLGKTINSKYLENYFSDLHHFRLLDKDVIKLSVPVYSSFQNQKIGYLVLLLYPDYFSQYTFSTRNSINSIYNRKNRLFIGSEIPVPKNLKDEGYFEFGNFLTIYKKIDDLYLRDWFILLQLNKESIFSPLKSMETIFIGVALCGMAIILILSSVVATRLVKPVKLLTETADYISRTKDYSKRVDIRSEDEIGILAKAFNNMLSEIQSALEKIKQENRERLRLFTKLIEIINRITSANSEMEVIDIVTQELESFLNVEKVEFTKDKKPGGISIPVDTESVKGFIHFDLKRDITVEEEQFLKSIGRMINLYIERLELLHKAQSASRAKSAFISNMSHELRTPLNSIIGFAQYLQMAETDEENIKAARSIELAGRHLLDMINDILDFAKIEAGAVKVNKRSFPVKKLIDEISAMVQPLIQEKGLKLILPENTDTVINTDYRLLKQVLLNLLSNAVKFTEEGYIKIDVRKDNGKIYFSVIDTGIGISRENIDKLFKDFTQLENPLQKKYKGTGLGLAISKKYIELLGGEIYAYSEGEGKGAKFEFYIPL
ncbi:MAG TPA: HAMP domain-containing protein [Persephonella sp.]|uniref:histidine kinase n=1 Tax=Persephonella marina (strain DSM 14350 / EX-H1) TaxID=123214 RepID=C0QRH0_PERMH|nr:MULTISPECIES: ATP-binding protein [Persephonella]ACO03959.1 histidine kinase [Persephonella marina EX-H1]HCB69012.1 HAMP domain-containing protein [Persephonella sp.]